MRVLNKEFSDEGWKVETRKKRKREDGRKEGECGWERRGEKGRIRVWRTGLQTVQVQRKEMERKVRAKLSTRIIHVKAEKEMEVGEGKKVMMIHKLENRQKCKRMMG